MSDSNRTVYAVLHQAFKTEYVVAESEKEAQEAAAGGWDTGDYAYGETTGTPNPVCPVEALSQVPMIGTTTIDRLLETESAIPLGPASTVDALPKRDVTRVRNQLENPSTRPNGDDSQ